MLSFCIDEKPSSRRNRFESTKVSLFYMSKIGKCKISFSFEMLTECLLIVDDLGHFFHEDPVVPFDLGVAL